MEEHFFSWILVQYEKTYVYHCILCQLLFILNELDSPESYETFLRTLSISVALSVVLSAAPIQLGWT